MTGSPGLRALTFLVFLTSCAAQPSHQRARWYGQASGGQQLIEVDFETPSPRQAQELSQRGVQLPRSAQGLADPRAHRDFIDSRVEAVGYGISEGGWVLFCEGLPLPVLVPEQQVDLRLDGAQSLNGTIYPDRKTALAAQGPGATHGRYAYYRGAGGALIVPTVFSPASTPRIAATMLQGAFSRVVRAPPEPRSPKPRAATPTPGPAPAPPAPAPGSLAPSPALVQALTGKNPTLRVAPGPRLPQDTAVAPKVPKQMPQDRPIGASQSQNAQLQVDVQFLKDNGATNIRVNQQQLKLDERSRVGINRPDLQFDYNGRRYHVEYDSPASGRGPSHQSRLISNDPDAEIILLIIP
jgi:hypothetical protein